MSKHLVSCHPVVEMDCQIDLSRSCCFYVRTILLKFIEHYLCMVDRKCQRINTRKHNKFYCNTTLYYTTMFLTTTYNLYNNLQTSQHNTILFHNNI